MLPSNLFSPEQLFLQPPFWMFVSWYLIMLRHCKSAHTKGNFTLFKVVCITQNLFFRQSGNFPQRMAHIFINNIHPGTFLSHFVNTSHYLKIVLELRLENYSCTEAMFYFQSQYLRLSVQVTLKFLRFYLFADEAFQLSTNETFQLFANKTFCQCSFSAVCYFTNTKSVNWFF